MGARSVIRDWGSTAGERTQALPCDALLGAPDAVLHRAVDVAAPVTTTYRWLCQLRAAPYSYDLIDNRGRRSPQTLTAGLEHLEVGQRMQTIFSLVSFEPGRSLTMQTSSPRFGHVACTYVATPIDATW